MILLDTQAVAWLALEPHLLSKKADEAILAARKQEGVAISDKTLWELAMMIAAKRIRVGGAVVEFLRETERFAMVLPINAEIAARSVAFGPKYPKDPADRVIGATALVYGIPLVTADRAIRASGGVPCIW